MNIRGILASPYGYMTVDTVRYFNGHPVIDNKLEGVSERHYVPAHWVEQPPTKEVK